MLDCPALDGETLAAFEARARADLLVRGAMGELQLVCDGRAVLRWRPAGAQLVSVELSLMDLDENELMEALADLLHRQPTEQGEPDEPPASTAQDVVAPDASESPSLPPPLPETANEERSRSEPGQGTQAAGPKAPRASNAEKTQRRQESKPTASATSTRALGWALRAGLSSSLLVKDVALGAQLGGELQLSPTLALLLEGSGHQVVSPIQGYTLQIADARVGAAVALPANFRVFASLGGSLVGVRAPAGRALVPNDGPCQFSGRSGSCSMLAGSVGLSFRLSRGSLSPEVAAQVDFSHRQLPIDEIARTDVTSRVTKLPYYRPVVIVRIAWERL